MLILDNDNQWNDEYGGDYFETAMIGLGFLLGMERAGDLPDGNVMSFGPTPNFPNARAPEAVYPGGGDTIHVQHLYRPDSNDIDTFRFTVDLNDAMQADKRLALEINQLDIGTT